MVYDIIISPTAQEGIKKFDPELQRRFFKKIEKLREYPDIMANLSGGRSGGDGN